MATDNDRFVPVATYSNISEAQLAQNVLEDEGIQSFCEGELASSALGSMVGDQIRLQVLERDAAAAAVILAELQARVELPGDWEEQAEGGYVCQTCDEPVPDGFSACPSCATPCESIRTDVPRNRFPRAQPKVAEEGVRVPEPPGSVTNRPREIEAPELGDRRPGCLGLLLGVFLLWW